MLKIKRIVVLLIIVLIITGCKDDSYSKAKSNGEEYEIVYIRRWSDSNYELKLKNGKTIEVHPMSCLFYNDD